MLKQRVFKRDGSLTKENETYTFYKGGRFQGKRYFEGTEGVVDSVRNVTEIT